MRHCGPSHIMKLKRARGSVSISHREISIPRRCGCNRITERRRQSKHTAGFNTAMRPRVSWGGHEKLCHGALEWMMCGRLLPKNINHIKIPLCTHKGTFLLTAQELIHPHIIYTSVHYSPTVRHGWSPESRHIIHPGWVTNTCKYLQMHATVFQERNIFLARIAFQIIEYLCISSRHSQPWQWVCVLLSHAAIENRRNWNSLELPSNWKKKTQLIM